MITDMKLQSRAELQHCQQLQLANFWFYHQVFWASPISIFYQLVLLTSGTQKTTLPFLLQFKSLNHRVVQDVKPKALNFRFKAYQQYLTSLHRLLLIIASTYGNRRRRMLTAAEKCLRHGRDEVRMFCLMQPFTIL